PTDTSGRAVFWMFPTVADLRISPPEGSGFAPVRIDSVSVRTDTAMTVHLVPTVTLRGRITDRDGGAVGAQPIQLVSFTTLYDTTDALGHYSLSASPGTYALDIHSLHGTANPRIPRQFMLRANDIVLAADSVLDIRLPNVSLNITVLDQVNAPVPGATISTEMAMTSTTFGAGPAVFHGSIGGSVVSDSAGQAVFWMFPTVADLRISPPEGSGFRPFRVDSVALTSDMTLVVHLERTTSVHSDDEPPTQFLLLHNYPNPFNPTTTVEFELPTAGRVRVSIDDLLGREAAVLVDEERPPGMHRATWDATRFPSGVYVCRLHTGGRVQMRKMILIK
ncbi:MAG: T9SS type A sorting domain-containing protein, partial [Bacteroidetes bacterium]|nr:T9SS type A sorting domain-containing protein [Bacteroidota bacterium]